MSESIDGKHTGLNHFFSIRRHRLAKKKKMNPITTANAEFCLDVFKELSSNNAGENIFFSPLTMFYALSMLLLGARGKSAEQMEKVRVGGEHPQNPDIFMCLLLLIKFY